MRRGWLAVTRSLTGGIMPYQYARFTFSKAFGKKVNGGTAGWFFCTGFFYDLAGVIRGNGVLW